MSLVWPVVRVDMRTGLGGHESESRSALWLRMHGVCFRRKVVEVEARAGDQRACLDSPRCPVYRSNIVYVLEGFFFSFWMECSVIMSGLVELMTDVVGSVVAVEVEGVRGHPNALSFHEFSGGI